VHSAPVAQPRIVAWLGYGGLLPFIALAGLTCLDREREVFWQGNLRAYGALILSFIGALHWGVAMVMSNITADQRSVMFVWSVVPCLLGFASLIAHSVLGDMLLVGGFLAHYWQDRRLAAMAALPAWYLPLRLRLTAIALVCLAAGTFFTGR
jgi:hypothetical protein